MFLRDRQRQIGTITCRICSAGYQTVINCKLNSDNIEADILDLSEPVDVYGEWVDAIDAQDQKRKAGRKDEERSLPGQGTSRRSSRDESDASESDAEYNQRTVREEEESEEDEFTEDDLVDYRQMPDRKRAKASEKSSKQAAVAKSKRKTISSSSDEGEEESEGLFGSGTSSESEADFTDSEADGAAGVQSDEPEESD